jgi:hypothetical protein
VTVADLLALLATFDPSMEVRVIGSGPVVATFVAVSREATGENVLLLSAVESSTAKGRPVADGDT